MRWHLDVFENQGGNQTNFSFPINKYKMAPCVGIGVQRPLTSRFDIGLEAKATFFRQHKQKWEQYSVFAHNIHSSFKNTLYTIRLKFTYNI